MHNNLWFKSQMHSHSIKHKRRKHNDSITTRNNRQIWTSNDNRRKKSKTNRKPRCIWHNDNFYNKITILKKHANLNKKIKKDYIKTTIN